MTKWRGFDYPLEKKCFKTHDVSWNMQKWNFTDVGNSWLSMAIVLRIKYSKF